ncbi:MAG: DsbA family protein [Hyphomicrobiales bacterium]|nr:DsbA family protein [Hyphomicrobiales bacterium]
MNKNKVLMVVILVIFVVAGVLAYREYDAPNFRFAELQSPKGFRALILNSQSSDVNPLLGVTPKTTDRLTAQAFCQTLYHDKDSPEFGPSDAKVTIVEFFDYRCPYCKNLMGILDQLREERPVRIIYKEWPILSEGSNIAARAALGAANQGKYKTFHSRFMNSRFLTTQAYVKSLAGDQNLDTKKLLKEMYMPEITKALQRNAMLASALGIIGTPALVVGRTIIQGAITKRQLEYLIDLEAATEQSMVC